ncbi:preprotein translocase subunit SecG [Maridesulfovibrio ferrireducens]|uniref:Protein-export membrane protein SecG n=1 Tax=Maridesulfovibrio ferrireducens TaxID=246191 RepID=A0A1G9I214_9BACT|nr:preprotein translocase subunit SecG [Maridesulfovibrio ferrireducens]MBI9111375.1 preprotein translocase subunit SecG [Maridesulfovibrio ferrireducens]SDL18954.1 preprotein translocase subunit SecG [Maridesulfovibrio ferrireducens]
MQTLVITVHIIACIFLIIFVLLQSGKEDMGVIFGGGSGSVFGSTGAGGVLVKITSFLAAVFLITSLSYNYLAGNKVSDDSIMLQGDGIVTPMPEVDKPVVTFEKPEAAKTEETK